MPRMRCAGGLASAEPRVLVRTLVHHVANVFERHHHYFLLAGVIGAEAMDTNPRVEAALREAYEAVATLARPDVRVLNGYNRRHPPRVITAVTHPPRPARGWAGEATDRAVEFLHRTIGR